MAKKLILIIDDEGTILRLLDNMLSKAGYEVITASSGKQGLDLFQSRQPDLVLLDVVMPIMDGFEVLENIRRLGTTPVVMMTGRVSLNDVISEKNNVPDSFIEKPSLKEQILTTIGYFFEEE
ncbi:MAG: response regulator [Deltaproteobacteria bacterium]|nr:response regulator [Deltaproteobacteria bacterium]